MPQHRDPPPQTASSAAAAEDTTRIVELLSAYFCHELISPLTAVTNGLELIADDPAATAEALELVRHSAAEAARRLQVFRFAYGQAAGFDPEKGLETVRHWADTLLEGTKVKLRWAADPLSLSPRVDKNGAKLLLALIDLAREALPRGGAVTVSLAEAGDGLELSVMADGPGASFKDEIRAALTGRLEPTPSRPGA
jgi:Uncharacterized protein conserved in bacteria